MKFHISTIVGFRVFDKVFEMYFLKSVLQFDNPIKTKIPEGGAHEIRDEQGMKGRRQDYTGR